MNQAEIIKQWESNAKKLLVGKTIKEVRYLTKKEQESMMWDRGSLVIILTDGTAIYPSADDEGNDAGALFTNNEELPTIPVI